MTDANSLHPLAAATVSAVVTVALFSLKELLSWRRERIAARGMLCHFATILSTSIHLNANSTPHVNINLIAPHLTALVLNTYTFIDLQEIQKIYTKWIAGTYNHSDTQESPDLTNDKTLLDAIANRHTQKPPIYIWKLKYADNNFFAKIQHHLLRK